MELLQKLRTNKFLIILFILLIVFIAVSCNQNNGGDIGYGKKIYTSKCVTCHNYKGESVSKVSLFKMSRFDSLYLLKKLEELNKSQTHRPYFNDTMLTSHDINSLLIFLKDFSKPPANQSLIKEF